MKIALSQSLRMNVKVTRMKLSHHRQIMMKEVLKLDSCVSVTPKRMWKITKNASCELYFYSIFYENSSIFNKIKLSGYQTQSGTLNWIAGPESNRPHKSAKLASYRGAPFVAGGGWNSFTELLNWTKDISQPMTWENKADFPKSIRNSIYRYSAVSTSTAVFITCDGIDKAISTSENGVVKYEDFVWSYVGALNYGPRHYHGSILLEG